MEGCRPSSTLSMSVNQLPSVPWVGEMSMSTCSQVIGMQLARSGRKRPGRRVGGELG